MKAFFAIAAATLLSLPAHASTACHNAELDRRILDAQARLEIAKLEAMMKAEERKERGLTLVRLQHLNASLVDSVKREAVAADRRRRLQVKLICATATN